MWSKLGCNDVLPTDMLSTCTWTCAQWAGINGNGNNYCEDDWSAKKFCVPYSSGLIKDYCKLSCNNCGRNILCCFNKHNLETKKYKKMLELNCMSRGMYLSR